MCFADRRAIEKGKGKPKQADPISAEMMQKINKYFTGFPLSITEAPGDVILQRVFMALMNVAPRGHQDHHNATIDSFRGGVKVCACGKALLVCGPSGLCQQLLLLLCVAAVAAGS